MRKNSLEGRRKKKSFNGPLKKIIVGQFNPIFSHFPYKTMLKIISSVNLAKKKKVAKTKTSLRNIFTTPPED